MILYPDVAFLLNTGLNYLVLCCTMRLLGMPLLHRRLLPAALLGGVYGALALLPPLRLLTGGLIKLLVAFLMAGIAYGKGKLLPRFYVLFWIASSVLSGAATALESVFWRTESPLVIFTLAVIVCALALGVVFFRGAEDAAEGKLLPARITHNGSTITVTLFHDTGNTLRDPETGRVVCIIERRAIQPLLRGTVGFRPLAYCSLGKSRGEIEVFLCDRIEIGGQVWERYPIALSDQPLCATGGVGRWGGEEKRKGDRSHAMAAKTV